MKTIKIIEINKETIIIMYGIQYFCLNNYGDNHKTKFVKYKAELTEKKNITFSDLILLNRKYNVNMMASRRAE